MASKELIAARIVLYVLPGAEAAVGAAIGAAGIVTGNQTAMELGGVMFGQSGLMITIVEFGKRSKPPVSLQIKP